MAFDGNGTYSALVSSFNPAVAATDISPTDWNSLLADLATALSTTICKDGQTTTTASIPFAAGLSTTGITAKTATAGVPIQGTTTNGSAAAGYVGEYLETVVLFGAGSGMGSNVPGAIASISLTAGDWDVWGIAAFSSAAGTLITKIIGCIGPTSAVITTPPAGGYAQLEAAFPASSGQTMAISPQRISLAATTTYYLNMNAVFTVSTCTGYGMIAARRRR